MRKLVGLILLGWIVLVIISGGKCHGQTPMKDSNQLIISDLEARKALRYKADAEYFWAVSMQKDSIISNQSAIIKKQKRKLFWQKTALIVQSSVFIYFIVKTQ